MEKRLMTVVAAIAVSTSMAFAQTSISGTVVSNDDEEPIIGASIRIDGTKTGTVTDINGNFSLIVPNKNSSLVISYLGMKTVTVKAVNGMKVVLLSDSKNLDDVVVTAQGLKRQKRSLGYATQEIKSSDLTSVGQQGLNNALAGKVAGARFVGGSGAKFDEGKIVLRGTTSLSSDNGTAAGAAAGSSPIYVVDGVITEAAAVNMNDVASVNVLKGPAATALCGVRGGNGAVIITTNNAKEGEAHQQINISNTLTWTTAYNHAKLQKEYGGGAYGADGELDVYHWKEGDPESYKQLDGKKYYDYADDCSWGPRFDSNIKYLPAIAWDETSPYFGQEDTWTSHLDMNDLFQTGVADNTNVSFERSGKDFSSRISLSNMNIKGVNPNSGAIRRYANIKTAFTPLKNLRVSFDYKYTYKKNHNAATEGYGTESNNPYSDLLQWGQTNVNLKQYKNYTRPDGSFRTWNIKDYNDFTPAFHDSPYAVYNEINNTNTREFHVLAGDIEYSLPYNIKVGFKTTANLYNFYQLYNRAGLTGQTDIHKQWQRKSYDVYNQGRITWDDKFVNDRLSAQAAIFIENRNYHYEGMDVFTRDGLLLPGFFRTTNSYGLSGGDDASTDATTNEVGDYDKAYTRREKAQSLFGTVTLGWDDTYFVDASLRNDWNSTLPTDNNSYLYGGLSVAAVASNWFKQAKWLDYWKLRASFAQVGSALTPYRLSTVYNFGYRYGSTASMYGNPQLIDKNIKPTITTSYEIGTEFSVLGNRLWGDINYYSRDTKNQIISTTVGPASGYSSRLMNAGLIRNRGYEISLGGKPIKTKNYEWTIEANIAHNENKLVELAPGMTRYTLDGMSFYSYLYSYAEVGKPMGALYVTRSWQTNENGDIILKKNKAGNLMPQIDKTTEKYIGNMQPKLTGGFSTAVRVYDFTLRASCDFRVGGKFASVTNMWLEGSGLGSATAGTNDRGGEIRGDISENGGVRVDGVVANEDGTYSPATTYVEANTYFQGLKSTLWEPYVYDGSYIKMRELSLTYNMPKTLLNQLHIGLQSASIAFVATDPFLLYSKVKNVDPSETDGTLFEKGQAVSTRSWGFTVNLTF